MLKWIILAVDILALIALVLANIRVVPQSKACLLYTSPSPRDCS